jgi:hypothetical protein
VDSSLVADVAQSKDESVNMKLKNLVSIFTMTSVEHGRWSIGSGDEKSSTRWGRTQWLL